MKIMLDQKLCTWARWWCGFFLLHKILILFLNLIYMYGHTKLQNQIPPYNILVPKFIYFIKKYNSFLIKRRQTSLKFFFEKYQKYNFLYSCMSHLYIYIYRIFSYLYFLLVEFKNFKKMYHLLQSIVYFIIF